MLAAKTMVPSITVVHWLKDSKLTPRRVDSLLALVSGAMVARVRYGEVVGFCKVCEQLPHSLSRLQIEGKI